MEQNYLTVCPMRKEILLVLQSKTIFQRKKKKKKIQKAMPYPLY